MSLVLNIPSNDVGGYFVTYTTSKVTIIPKLASPKLFPELGKLLERLSCRDALHHLYNLRWRISGEVLQQIYARGLPLLPSCLSEIHIPPLFSRRLPSDIPKPLSPKFACGTSVSHQVILQILQGMLRPSYPHAAFISAKCQLWQEFASPNGELLSSRQQADGYSAGFFIKGQYSHGEIWVKPEEPRAQQLKTLIHEIAHYYSEGVFRIPRQDAETIAESGAYVVGAHFGFDTGVRSFPYVALWAQDRRCWTGISVPYVKWLPR